ncbi:NUDIX domain-containing protein [Actinomycetaceae bacterium TAE3-ERU4]|nr:NUDIX domain-containing protein [Actinomycetaceae bacterium TAE3-ERU4]
METGARFQEASQLPGAPDAFSRLWTPHRMAYIGGDAKPSSARSQECPFCQSPKESDEDGLIVYRGELVFVVMNLFPYNSGHLLVLPYRHVPQYVDMTPAERQEFGEVTAWAMRVLKRVTSCHGMNLGMNQGEVAGAGIAAHLHQHIVPRWSGDANFFPLIAQTKAIPKLLEQQRKELQEAWFEVSDFSLDVSLAQREITTPQLGQRQTARALITDSAGNLLLVRGRDEGYPDGRECLYTIGGGLEAGESPISALVREIYEETGIRISDNQIGEPIASRDAVLDYLSGPIKQHELFYSLVLDDHIDLTATFGDSGSEKVVWISPKEVEEFAHRGGRVFPSNLLDLLPVSDS